MKKPKLDPLSGIALGAFLGAMLWCAILWAVLA